MCFFYFSDFTIYYTSCTRATHALYKMNNERVSFPSFCLQVLRALLNLDPNDSNSHLPKLSRLIGRHFPKLLDKNRRCNLCSLRQTI